MSDRRLERTEWKSTEKLGVDDPGTAPTPVPLLKNWAAILDDDMDFLKRVIATILPFNVKIAEKIDLDKTDVIAVFRKEN